MRKCFLFILFLFGMMVGYTQEMVIKGTVKDDSGEPLGGVSILLKGTSKGTTTDFDGNYEINASNGDFLEFSYIGFQTQTKEVKGPLMDVMMKSGIELSDVVVVGSRNPARTATETAVPVDVIDVKELASNGPQVNLNQILNYVAPSFSSNTQTIADGTDHLDPASLRGLGPDQVLVLINGKRRHTSSLVNINGTFGRGSVGTDLNAIPASAIQRIEVLRDGAAAQYGSDAIAGVINIVLNKSIDELKVGVTTGANFSKNANGQTGGVDGETVNVNANYGIGLGDKGGYINFTGDFDYRKDYNRMKSLDPETAAVFTAYNSIEWVAQQDGYDLTGLATDVDAIKMYGAQVSHFSPELKNNISNASSIADLQAILGANTTLAEIEARNLKLEDFNMRLGQSRLRGGRFFANFGLPLDDQGTELYAFAGVGSRNGNSTGFYRLPSQGRTYTPAFINGFLPEIDSKIKDKSLAVGIRGKVHEWNVDFSNTYGKNIFLFEVLNSSNFFLKTETPRRFDCGGFSFTQNTVNLDINRFYDDVMSGLNLAFGAEYRHENYEIVAGEEASYASYDVDGQVITSDDQIPFTGFFGEIPSPGVQVFPGFSPDNEVSRDRSSVAGYLDIEADITEQFLASFATRFENYSDFGSTLNFKVATRYKVNDNLNFRAAFNTGFRAPSLHQLYFNSTSTQTIDGVPRQVGTFSNDSRLAQLFGIPQLKQETSKSVSVGFTAKIPDANLTLTLDGYFVRIDDRVVLTSQFKPNTDEQKRIYKQTGADNATFFANAIDTESKGLDFVLTHKAGLGNDWSLKSDLSATLSKTKRVGDIHASDKLKDDQSLQSYFGEDSRVFLEEAVPRTKINLTNSLTDGKWSVFLRNVLFGAVTESTTDVEKQQVFGAKVVTDLSLGYKFSDHFGLTLGANNLLDIYPDRNAKDLRPDRAGIQSNRGGGQFDWSRRSQQFGIGGRFLFARLNITL